MDKQMKRERGITLIALVVTIVVLLILATVSIGMLTGENGIITQAQNSKEQTEIGYEKEQVSLAYSSAKTKKISEGDTSEINANDMNDQLNLQKANATARGSNPIIVKFNDSKREYEIDNNGEVAERPSSDIEISNIFKYETQDGLATITGIKEEYLITIENTTGKTNPKMKIASLEDKYIADYLPPSKLLTEEIGTSLEIPDEIDGNKVIAIGENAFERIVNLESIVLSGSIIKIESEAFSRCGNLKSITIQNGITEIAYNAFNFCNNIETIIVKGMQGSMPVFGEEHLAEYDTSEYESFATAYLNDKNPGELEELTLKSARYLGTFDDLLKDANMTREDLEKLAAEEGLEYADFLRQMLREGTTPAYKSWAYIEYNIHQMKIDNSELENVFIVEIIGRDEFNKELEELGMTKEEWFEDACQQYGFRSNEDLLKYCICFKDF